MENIRVINSAETVWLILKDLSVNKLNAEELKISFDDFPNLNIKYEGVGFDSALPVRCFDAISKIQSEIYRLYALTVYDDEHKILSKYEKDDLEIFFKIEKGSSIIDPENIQKILELIVEHGLKKMNANHVIVLTLIIVAGWTVPSTIQKWIESSSLVEIEKAKIESHRDENKDHQDHETERLKIIRDIITSKPAAQKALESVDRVHEAIAKSVKGNN